MNVFHLRFSLVASVIVSWELLMQTCWWPLSDHWSVHLTSPHLTCLGLCAMAAWKLNGTICAMVTGYYNPIPRLWVIFRDNWNHLGHILTEALSFRVSDAIDMDFKYWVSEVFTSDDVLLPNIVMFLGCTSFETYGILLCMTKGDIRFS